MVPAATSWTQHRKHKCYTQKETYSKPRYTKSTLTPTCYCQCNSAAWSIACELNTQHRLLLCDAIEITGQARSFHGTGHKPCSEAGILARALQRPILPRRVCRDKACSLKNTYIFHGHAILCEGSITGATGNRTDQTPSILQWNFIMHQTWGLLTWTPILKLWPTIVKMHNGAVVCEGASACDDVMNTAVLPVYVLQIVLMPAKVGLDTVLLQDGL